MIYGGMPIHVLNTDWSMKLFKKFLKNYLFFGVGVIFGSIIATLVTYTVFAISHGTPSAAKVLQIQKCLEQKINE